MAEGDAKLCRWCGEDHGGPRCPWVKAIEFSSGDERITRVEFLTPTDCGPPQRHETDEPAPYDKLKPMTGG